MTPQSKDEAGWFDEPALAEVFRAAVEHWHPHIRQWLERKAVRDDMHNPYRGGNSSYD